MFESGTSLHTVNPGTCPEGHELRLKDTAKAVYFCPTCRSNNNKRNIDFVIRMLKYLNSILTYTPYVDAILEEQQLDVAA